MKLASILVFSLILAACQSEKANPVDLEKNGNAKQQEQESLLHADVEEHSHHVEKGHHHHTEDDGHDDHHHGEEDKHQHTKEQLEQIYAGYFDDEQIQNRELTDWAGDWQSVYPFLLDGTLDEVFEYKAELNHTKTAEEYKAYYEMGYKTSVNRIVMEGNQVTFYNGEQANTGEYMSDGYEVLTYEKGNRGVRFIFKLVEPKEGLPTYIQFSDHSIYPTEAGHYHLYWGDDRSALLEELDNWPTYYPSTMDGHTIAHEMMAH